MTEHRITRSQTPIEVTPERDEHGHLWRCYDPSPVHELACTCGLTARGPMKYIGQILGQHAQVTAEDESES